MATSCALSERDEVLHLVLMFHASGGGIRSAAVMVGSKIVLSGRYRQPADIAAMIEGERATFTAGVPTLWMGLYGLLESQSHDISSLRTIVCAGSALPRQFVELYEKKHNLRFMLAWGMTETTPIATVVAMKTYLDALPEKDRFDLMARHGLPIAGIDGLVVDQAG